MQHRAANMMVLVAVAVAFLAPATVSPGSRAFLPESVFRYNVAASDIIVVGRVICLGQRGRADLCEIQVDRALYGPSEPGDTLRIRRYALDTVRVPPILLPSKPEPPRPRVGISGVTALWLLRAREEMLLLSGDPVILEPCRTADLRLQASWISDPRPSDILTRALRGERLAFRADSDLDDASQKLAAVGAYIQGYLDGAESFGTGRSN